MAFKDIQILRMNYLRGPNIWTYRPIIEALIDLERTSGQPALYDDPCRVKARAAIAKATGGAA